MRGEMRIWFILAIYCMLATVAIGQEKPSKGVYFSKNEYTPSELPNFKDIKEKLPFPIISDTGLVDMYDFCWEEAFRKLKNPLDGSPFVSNYIDEAFGPHIFQWDTHFMIMFWKYAHHIFPAIESHDNFYASQEIDGYICREIREADGEFFYFRGKDNTINPPLFPWVEYQYYLISGDDSRFLSIIPPLEKYAEWIEHNRKYPGSQPGLYWQTNLGSGMDNSPRTGTCWVDMSAQMALFYEYLSKIIMHNGNSEKAEGYHALYEEISCRINYWMWDENDGLYYDVHDFGEKYPIKTVAAFWPMLSDIPDSSRAAQLVANLKDSTSFWRRIPFPTLAANEPAFDKIGDYWLGSVWAPTNYAIIKGLENYGYYDFAYEASLKYLDGMKAVFEKTGTVWENYSPDSLKQGDRANRDFVGWTGLGPISLLIENVIGIKANAPDQKISWHIHRKDRHGIKNLTIGKNSVTLIAEPFGKQNGERIIMAITNEPVFLEVFQNGIRKTFQLKKGMNSLKF